MRQMHLQFAFVAWWINFHGSTRVEGISTYGVAIVSGVFIEVDGELLIALDVQTLIDRNLHPGWLQPIPLHRVGNLESFGRLFPIGVLLVDRDPPIVLAKQTISKSVFTISCSGISSWGRKWSLIHQYFVVFGLALLPRLIELVGCFDTFLAENAWSDSRHFNMKVVGHWVLSFVTVETRTMCPSFFRVSLEIGKDFGTHPKLGVVLRDIVLSFVDPSTLRLSLGPRLHAWSTFDSALF